MSRQPHITFVKAVTVEQRQAVNLFLTRYNQRGQGSRIGFVAYFAATVPPDGRFLVERIVAAAKICPLHTPQAAKFFAGADWRHVYGLQRLAALHPPKNLLSQFVAWCLQQIGSNPKVWYVATYADSGMLDPRTQRPHDGGIYRATNAVYCGRTAGRKVEAYILDGQRRSLRCGPKTLRIRDLPPEAKLIRSAPKLRYCWPVGAPLKRAFRRRRLVQRMQPFQFEAVYQPRLLVRLWCQVGGMDLSMWKAINRVKG